MHDFFLSHSAVTASILCIVLCQTFTVITPLISLPHKVLYWFNVNHVSALFGLFTKSAHKHTHTRAKAQIFWPGIWFQNDSKKGKVNKKWSDRRVTQRNIPTVNEKFKMRSVIRIPHSTHCPLKRAAFFRMITVSRRYRRLSGRANHRLSQLNSKIFSTKSFHP